MLKITVCTLTALLLSVPASATPLLHHANEIIGRSEHYVLHVNDKRKTTNNRRKRGPGSGDVLLGTVAEIDAAEAKTRKKRAANQNTTPPSQEGQLLEKMITGAGRGLAGDIPNNTNNRKANAGNRQPNYPDAQNNDYQQQPRKQNGYCAPQYDTPFPKPCE